METNIEWLEDYCMTMESIIKAPDTPAVERQECRMKLRATKEQIRQLKEERRKHK